ncbi:MAG: ROK family protein [Firmicutes bacterium]|nr:ROK family protein [Bacillota bacterium]
MNYVGIDVGGTNVKIALVNEKGQIVKKASLKTKSTRDAIHVIGDIADGVIELTQGFEYEAIGVGCPGAIDSEAGIVEYSPNLYWKNVALAKGISERTGKPVKISNDANVAALGETKFGAGKSFSDTALLTLGTGLGGGFVVNGKLFEGYKSMGTEIGHTVLKENGVQCSCGRKGCMEVYTSATALIRETLFAMQTDKNSMMWDHCGKDLNKVDGRTAFACARKNDASALKVVDAYIRSLAEGILNVVAVFRSQAVILGGGVSGEREYLTDQLQKYVDERRYGGKDSLRTVILTAQLGNDAGVIGAASLVM